MSVGVHCGTVGICKKMETTQILINKEMLKILYCGYILEDFTDNKKNYRLLYNAKGKNSTYKYKKSKK